MRRMRANDRLGSRRGSERASRRPMRRREGPSTGTTPDSPAPAGRRRKAPHRVPQRRGGGGLHDIARHFQSILDESGRSAAWLAHLPWVKSRPDRGRLFRVIQRIPQRIRTRATADSPRIAPRHRCTPPKVPRRVPQVLEQWKALVLPTFKASTQHSYRTVHTSSQHGNRCRESNCCATCYRRPPNRRDSVR